MLEPGMKCKVVESTPLVEAGTPVVVDKASGKNGTPDIITGKTGMIMCKMPQGGSLFFDESNLELQPS